MRLGEAQSSDSVTLADNGADWKVKDVKENR